uniref:Lipase n=1 Tax=Ascaris suum TaxID=6253 RepID=F1L4U1_ASCSU
MVSINILFSFTLLLLVTAAPQRHLTDYDEANAKMLLNLAAAAYSNTPETCVNITMPSSQKWYIIIEESTICDAHDSSCSGYTIRSDVARQYIVVFRGTKTKKQLLIEGWKSLKPGVDFYGVGKVNRYFSRALDTIWPNIEILLKDADTRSYTVTFTGHSLGGALASLAAMRTVLENLRSSHEVKLVTFGQPRVGDRELAMKHDELVPHSYRVVHRADIVPHLPACQKDDDDSERKDDKSKPCDTNGDGRAYHHGTEIWYPYGMKPGAEYFECLGRPKGEDFNCSDSLTFDLSEYDIYISDHRHYFDHKVPTYGKLGCVELTEEVAVKESAESLGQASSAQSNTESALRKVINSVATVARFLGIHRK